MTKLLRAMPALAAALLIAGCGGGGGGSQTSLSGTAATGAPVAGAAVALSCGSSNAFTATNLQATTAGNGAFTVEIGANVTFPCLVTVTGGSLPAGTQLTSYATSATNVDVTPVTTLISAYAQNAANGGKVTQSILDTATQKVVAELTAGGFANVPADPLTAPFTPANGNAYDDLIEALMLSLSQQGTTLTQVASDITKSGAPLTAQVISPNVTAFDAIPDPLPGNLISYGFEAAGFSTLGDRVALAAGTPRNLRGVTIVMSSWACQSGGAYTNDCATAAGATFTHPVTLNIYDDSTNTLLASSTQSFTMPYRPSADPSCTNGGWKSADGACNHGMAFKIAFDLSSLKVTLPDNVRYEIAYNTSTYGAQPLGVTGPYDSLNVGLYDVTQAQPTVGSELNSGFLIENGTATSEGYGLTVQIQTGS